MAMIKCVADSLNARGLKKDAKDSQAKISRVLSAHLLSATENYKVFFIFLIIKKIYVGLKSRNQHTTEGVFTKVCLFNDWLENVMASY